MRRASAHFESETASPATALPAHARMRPTDRDWKVTFCCFSHFDTPGIPECLMSASVLSNKLQNLQCDRLYPQTVLWKDCCGARHLNNDNGIFDAMLVDGLPITAAANAVVRRFVLFFKVLTFVIIGTAFLERNVLQTFPKKADGAVLLIFYFSGLLTKTYFDFSTVIFLQ